MKENLFLPTDLFEPWKIKFIKLWLQFQKNMYFAKLGDTGNKYKTYHSAIKMKSVDGKLSTYIDFTKENKVMAKGYSPKICKK